MYKLSEDTKKRLSDTIGMPYEKIITMDDDEITSYIEQKIGKKLAYSKPHSMLSGSGDDSVLIDSGRFRTMEEVDKKIAKITKNHKCKKIKPPKNIINEEDILGL